MDCGKNNQNWGQELNNIEGSQNGFRRRNNDQADKPVGCFGLRAELAVAAERAQRISFVSSSGVARAR